MPEQEPEAESPAPDYTLVTVADIFAIDFEEPIRGIDTADSHTLSGKFSAAAAAANSAEKARLFRFLSSLTGFHFTPESPSEPFGPMSVMDGRRSLIPSDFGGPLNSVLCEALKKASHPALRARVADTIWLNNRRERWAADAAIEAYVACSKGLLDHSLAPRFKKDRTFPHEVVDLVHRALRIARTVGKRGADLPEAVSSMAKEMLAAARAAQDSGGWLHAAKLCFQFGLVDSETLAAEAEAFALAEAEKPDLGVKELWAFAADAYEEAGKAEHERRCRIEAAEQMVKAGRAMGGFAAASWTMDAIDAYRRIRGTRERRKELEAELREQQVESLDQFGSFSQSMDLGDIAEATTAGLSELTLAVSLGHLADISRSEPMEKLRAEARKSLDDFPLSSLFSAQKLDEEGKVVSVSPGGVLYGEPDEAWYRHKIAERQSLHRHLVIKGQFEPFRRVMLQNYSLSERHFLPIVQLSPFVPPGHKHIIALGFARLMQGDFLSAAHLLIPQLENSLRYILKQVGEDPSMIQADLVQEDRSIAAILTEHREVLTSVLGAPIVDEIDLLFHDRAGPALRHQFAHGKLTEGDCHGHNAVYACWFLYRLTCLPLFEFWDSHVVPRIIH